MPCPVDAYPSALINLPPTRVIIPALQIIQPRFRVVDVPAVAQGVGRAKCRCHCTGGAQQIAPCVVGVGHDARAAGGNEAGHVALRVLDVEILRAVAVHGQRAGRVVGEVQLIAAPRQLHQLVAQIMVIIGRAVDGFCDALAVVIVGIRPRLSRRLIVLAHKLVEAVVGVGRRVLAVGDEGLQWYRSNTSPHTIADTSVHFFRSDRSSSLN